MGVAAGLVVLTTTTARSDDQVWKLLSDSRLGIAQVVEKIDGIVERLDGSSSGALSGIVMGYSPVEDERLAVASEADDALGRMKDALEGAGFSLEGFPGLSVVVVRSPGGASGAGVSPSGQAVFARLGTGTSQATPTAPRRPADGAPTARAVVGAADLAITALDATASAAQPERAPLRRAVARALLQRARLPSAAPPWLVEGMVAWLVRAGFPDEGVRTVHRCGAPAASVATLLTPRSAPTVAQAEVLADLVELLLSGATDGPKRVERVTAAGDRAPKTLAEILGKDPAAVLAGAAGAAGKAKASCDAAGTVPCPAGCRGGKVEVACEPCHGFGGVACSSCGAAPRCAAPGCVSGVQYRKDGLYKCRMCASTGWSRCTTCKDKARLPCKVCAGTGKSSRACLVCVGRGRVACAEGGGLAGQAAVAPCPWCSDRPHASACAPCGGSGA